MTLNSHIAEKEMPWGSLDIQIMLHVTITAMYCTLILYFNCVTEVPEYEKVEF